jgi:outer membrane protein assembly factor BamB
MNTSRRAAALALALCAVTAGAESPAATRSADAPWPQLWGPHGDGSATGTRLAGSASPTLREVWRRPIGSAFSELTIGGGRGYTGLAEGGQDYTVAIDLASGKELWRTPLGETYKGHDGSRDGPVSTPTFHQGRVYMISAYGVFQALDAATGKVAWQHDLQKDFGAPKPFYGFGTSAVAVGDRVVVQAGGEKNGLIAFDAKSGAKAWSVSHSTTSGYSTPVLATIHGVPQVVVLANDKVFGASPKDGALLWSAALPQAQGESAKSPLVLPDGRVLAAQWNETTVYEVKKDGETWTATMGPRTPLLRNTYSATVYHDGHLYSFNNQNLICLDAKTLEAKWRQRLYGGFVTLIDGHLVTLSASSGMLHVAAASPAGYQEKTKIAAVNAGAMNSTGVSAGGDRLYVRNVEELVAFEIGGGK